MMGFGLEIVEFEIPMQEGEQRCYIHDAVSRNGNQTCKGIIRKVCRNIL